jgi:hypothetical protein
MLSVLAFAGTEAETPHTRIVKLAESLSQGDHIGALESFDKKMSGYSEIDSALSALTAQAEVLCAIDIVEDEEGDGIHNLDLDWYMQLKSRTDPGLIERRRQRVAVTLQKNGANWRIIKLAPREIFAPIAIR